MDDEALRSALFEAKKYVHRAAAQGISSEDLGADFNRHYEALRPAIDSIARAYGRTSGRMSGVNVSLYRIAEDSLRGYIHLLHISELQRKGQMVMC